MRDFIAFTKKEFIENVRTYRLYILGAVFLFIGIINPLTALFLPEILGSIDIGGIIELSEPTAMDSWIQFFSNTTLGMLALIISYCGIMANEFSRGTLVNLLTKGMRRQIVIWSKFLSTSIIWTGAYLLCLGVTYAYTVFYWSGAEWNQPIISFLAPWLFGIFIIVLLIFGGVLTGTFSGTLLTSGVVIVLLNLLNIVPTFQRFNPVTLASGTINLLNFQNELADYLPAIIITLIASASVLIISVIVFNKKKI